MSLGRRAGVVLIIAAVAATVGWFGAPRLASVAQVDCGTAPTFLQFCPALPSFRPPESAPVRLADQIRPCEDADAFRPSFCVALPGPGAVVDRQTLVTLRQTACAQLSLGDAPAFCLAIPSSGTSVRSLEREAALVTLRQRLGSDFRRASRDALDLWVETGVSAPDASRIEAVLRYDTRAVEAYFERQFREMPAVFVFATPDSFALALEKQFGYSRGMAGQLSQQYGGLLVSGIGAIAINGRNALSSGQPTIFRHELTHAMTHELAGVVLPMWFDEGLATLVADADVPAFDLERATALSILGDASLRTTAFDETRSWLDRNESLGGHAYAVAAEAVRLIVDRHARAGLIALLDSAGRGAPFASAYATATGSSYTAFLAEIPARVLAGCPRGLGMSATRPDGLILWRIYGFGRSRSVSITADGPAHYAFAVTTDVYGVYTGTLGAPMPTGTYVLRAATGSTAVSMDVAIGTAAVSNSACGA